MYDDPKARFIRDHILLLAVSLMVLYWFLEAAVHVLVFGQSGILAAFFPADINELWMRGLICGLFLVFGFYTKSVVARLRHTEQLLSESENKCRRLDDELHKANELREQAHQAADADRNYKIQPNSR